MSREDNHDDREYNAAWAGGIVDYENLAALAQQVSDDGGDIQHQLGVIKSEFSPLTSGTTYFSAW